MTPTTPLEGPRPIALGHVGHGHGPSTAAAASDEAFWKWADRSRGTSACWPWTGRLDRQGYGRVHARSAHRRAWTLANGPIPEGLCVLHACDHPPCVNPAHLFLGTMADNYRDMIAKGRESAKWHRRGSAQPNAKLTEDDVRRIHELRAAGAGIRPLGRQFGVHHRTIQAVLTGRRWKHVEVAA